MLKDTEFAYAVARVRSNENKLLSTSAVESLINAPDYKDAIKILSESGYGDFEKNDEDVLLSARLREAFELICESAPEKQCLDFLIVKNDFHNIKACLKCMVLNTEPDDLFIKPSVVDPLTIKKALNDREFTALPDFLEESVREGYNLITKTMDGQTLEVYLDKKCIEASIILAEKSGNEFSKSIAGLSGALSDIKIALRCLKTGKDRNFLMSALAKSNLLDIESLCDAALSGIDELCSYVKKTQFSNLADGIMSGYALFEKMCDDILVDKIKHAKYECLGISPLVAYYFATDAEIKTVRIILSCKKNGFGVEKIRERVRVLYV